MPNQHAPLCPDDEFINLINTHGPVKTSRILKCSERAVYKRRAALEKHYGTITGPTNPDAPDYSTHEGLTIQNGLIIVGSDFHIWPGTESVALRAFKKLCKELKPSAVILNGDVLDFPVISRHQAIMWRSMPLPVQEIEAAQDHLNDIAKACGRAHKIWTIGNHDSRFDTFLANATPKMKGIQGTSLMDHFALWRKTWSVRINMEIEGGRTVIKHRFKGGMNATRANALNSGVSMVTGHLHSQKVTPLSDYSKYDRYGVDSGCVADKDHTAFIDYTEDNPLDWRSGFCILTYRNGRLMMPELISKWDDKHVQWRGQLIKV